jgi:TonB family protein
MPELRGNVLVDVVVRQDGTVGDDVTVVQSLETRFGLDEPAVQASKQWRFKPATKDGEPVATHITIELSSRRPGSSETNALIIRQPTSVSQIDSRCTRALFAKHPSRPF